MGYKGFIQLAMRSGQFKTINVTDVKEGEISSRNLLTGEIVFTWIEDMETRSKAKTIGYVSYFKLLNGFEKLLYMTTEESKFHGNKYSKSFKSGFGLWKDDFDAMAKKTVIKLLLSKFAPMTVEMQKAILADQAVIDADAYEYPDNERLTTDEISIIKERERVITHIQTAKTVNELKQCEDALTNETQSAYDSKLKELTK